MTTYPKRLIEVDLPIKRISAHARREKSIRHGHISTLHIWWARRPLAACRAVICAALWPDPVDENCPVVFRKDAAEIITNFAKKAATDQALSKHCSTENWNRWQVLAKPENQLDPNDQEHLNILRYRLLDFIADFANWDNSTNSEYLETSRALTQAAHEALGGIPGTKPLVVDPFAGGGSIPLEALRVGADAFASDLNPVAVLLNKVVLEYIPKYGQTLADEVKKWGQWVKEEAEKELAEFYPKDEDGSTPIAYLWARTIISEAPDDGTGIPVEVPLIRSLWLAKKKNRNRALKWVRDETGAVKTETVEVTYADGVTRKVRRPLLEIFEPKNAKEVERGTVARGSATCPVTKYTTPAVNVRNQFKGRCGGANDSRLLCVVLVQHGVKGRSYRLSNQKDIEVVNLAKQYLYRRAQSYRGRLSLIPDEELPYLRSIFNINLLDVTEWGHLFSCRQLLMLITLIDCLRKIDDRCAEISPKSMKLALKTCLAFVVDRQANTLTSLSRWNVTGEKIEGVFARQAMGIVWDFGEGNPFSNSTGCFDGALKWVSEVCEANSLITTVGQAEACSASAHILPDDSVSFFSTDPPYYDAVPYADLSDFFYVWLRRALGDAHKSILQNELTPKNGEIVQLAERNQKYAYKTHAYFEDQMAKAMGEGCRVLSPSGIGVIVFAHKSTSGWEAQLQAMVDAGWTITGSWPIDTEMGSRLRAMDSAALASSIHLVCRPRENPDGTLKELIGDWRDVLQELPQRIHEWLPRLAAEGVVGADAIFACLGPALEVFSRYSSVEKASGEQVTLKEYLEYVWAAVSKEALSMIFEDADATGFEEDARITAMWLWTLSTATSDDKTDNTKETDESDSKTAKSSGFTLEFDAARKIAQGLGVHLENLSSLIEVKKDKARLLPVAERARQLLTKENTENVKKTTKKKKNQKSQQLSLFEELGIKETEDSSASQKEIEIANVGKTVLDRIHQTMLLFAAGRGEGMKRFLVEEGIGSDPRFWKLAQALSALYPVGTDEKRWVDGVLARKKGLGF